MANILITPNILHPTSERRTWLIVAGAAVLWLVAYNSIQPLADWITYTLIGTDRISVIRLPSFCMMCPRSCCSSAG